MKLKDTLFILEYYAIIFIAGLFLTTVTNNISVIQTQIELKTLGRLFSGHENFRDIFTYVMLIIYLIFLMIIPWIAVKWDNDERKEQEQKQEQNNQNKEQNEKIQTS